MAKNVQYFQGGERIIEAGQIEKRMYVILEGSVMIMLAHKNERVCVATLSKGDFFGEISLFNNTPRSANAIAQGQVRLAYIDNAEQLRSFLKKNPNFAAKMVANLAMRLAKTDELLIGKIDQISRLKIMQDV